MKERGTTLPQGNYVVMNNILPAYVGIDEGVKRRMIVFPFNSQWMMTKIV